MRRSSRLRGGGDWTPQRGDGMTDEEGDEGFEREEEEDEEVVRSVLEAAIALVSKGEEEEIGGDSVPPVAHDGIGPPPPSFSARCPLGMGNETEATESAQQQHERKEEEEEEGDGELMEVTTNPRSS